MFSTFDCAVKGYRQKEDAWNAIISGFMTGGCLAARSECRMLALVTFKNLTMFASQVVQKLLSDLPSLVGSYLAYLREWVFYWVGYSQKGNDRSFLLVSTLSGWCCVLLLT